MAHPLPSNLTDSVSIFTYLDGVVNNWFFPGVLIAAYIIILVRMLINPNNTAAKSFAAVSFIIMILSVFARVMDFVSTGFMSIFIILTAIGGIWMHIENS